MTSLKKRVASMCGRVLSRDPGEISRLIDPYEVVSFDVFDTLLYRKVGAPEEVFEVVDARVGFSRYGLGSYVGVRVNAEKAARRRLSCGEITYFEIFNAMATLAPSLPGDVISELAEAELAVERETLCARSDMQAVYACARSAKRVFVISDMYLDGSFVEEALRSGGYDIEGVDVSVSSSAGCTKRSGDLFRFALGESLGSCCHVGDNLMSDWVAPRKLGMAAHLVSAQGGRRHRTTRQKVQQ